jgi:hypothetical protein
VILISVFIVGFGAASALGRPDNCDDTAYQAHPGYNENAALWDSYMADTDGVCQTRYGTGIPSDECEHTVQVSVQGNPYYLCWYNNAPENQPVQTNFFQNIINAILSFFRSVSGAFTAIFSRVVVVNATIGPYPDMYACEFFQTPWPGVNVKRVTCPIETPGAAINENDDEFCRIAMGSDFATAAVCDANGLIVCVHPCETQPPTLKAQRCAFDSARQRGSQAPPLEWCPPEEPVVVEEATGRPDNCDDTAYQAHPGYNGNEELWDGYMADTDGVCQTRTGTGIPSSPCEHTVQQSVGGTPYYLCWYNKD